MAVVGLPDRSVTAPAARFTLRVPVVLAVGVTCKVYWVALTGVNIPAVPPVMVMSLTSKPATASLKLNVNKTGPLAVVTATLSAIVTMGATVSATAATLMAREPAALVLPAASVCEALSVSAPCPMAVMSAAVSV